MSIYIEGKYVAFSMEAFKTHMLPPNPIYRTAILIVTYEKLRSRIQVEPLHTDCKHINYKIQRIT